MRVVIAAIVGLVVMAGAVHAQESPKSAEAAFEKGRTLMTKKRYAEACAAFELSQRLDPQFGTQFNLAGCYAALDKIATAWKLYRELARGDSNAARRGRSTELAKKLAPRVPKLKIRVDQQEPGMKIAVGDTDVTALLGAELPFDLGRYTIEGTLPGHRTFTREIEVVAPGKVLEVEVVFEKDTGPPPDAKPIVVRPPPPRSTRARNGKIVMASGIAVVGFGFVAGWRALVDRDASRDQCTVVRCPDFEGSQASADRAKLWGNLSTATIAVGAIAVVGGIYLWRSAPSRVQVGAAAGTDSASVVLRGAF